MANQLSSVLKLKCPRCGEGDMFCNKNVYQYKGFFDMHENCPHCGQKFELEPGFYYGAMYVSYGLTIVISVAVFVAMSIFNVFSIKWYLVADILALVLTLPYVFKVSRSLWLMLMVKPDETTIHKHEH